MLLAFALAFAPYLAPSPPQEPSRAEWLATIDVRGAKAFSAAAVRQGLEASPVAWRALEGDADEAAFARSVAAIAEQGYRAAGYGDVRTTGRVDGGRLVLDIAEGPLYRCGDIVVDGARAVPAATLQAAL